MKKAVLIRWLKYQQVETDEMEDLARAAGYTIIREDRFKSDKPHREHFIPVQKFENLKEFLEDYKYEEVTILIDGSIYPHQMQEIKNQTGCEVVDKVMLVLEIFELRASTKDVLLQIEMAKLIYTSPQVTTMISQNVQTERQARERGSGEQITDVAKTNISNRIAKIRKQLNAMKSRTDLSISRDGVLRIPIIGFYSAGKSTLFNILTGSDQEVHEEAFTTMFSKIQRSKKFGYPLDFVDTVGLVDLPNNVLNAFNLLLEPLFSTPVITIALDSTIFLNEWEIQLSQINDIIHRFTKDREPKFIVIHTKVDQTDKGTLRGRSDILNTFYEDGTYVEIATRKDKPELAIEAFIKAFEYLAEDLLVHFEFKEVTPAALSSIFDLARVEEQEWGNHGTCKVKGTTLHALFTQIQEHGMR